MRIEDQTPREAYLEGRLLGLNQLISILKDAMAKEGGAQPTDIEKTMVVHISSEMNSIIAEMKEYHGEHPVLKQVEEKMQGTPPAQVQPKAAEPEAPEAKPQEEPKPELKEKVEAADDLMKSLLALKKEGGKEEPQESQETGQE